MTFFKPFVIALLWASLGIAQALQSAQVNPKHLPNFHVVVSQKFFRGAQPTTAGFQDLKAMGIVNIIDLRHEQPELVYEKKIVEGLGMHFIPFPMSYRVKPSDEYINSILQTITQSAPVFVHCHLGEDRTGLVVGLFRVLLQKQNPKTVYENDMLALGFHPQLKALKDYYCSRTRYCP